MNVTIQQAEKILKGNQTFSQFGFSMLVTRLKTVYLNDPSPVTVKNCADEINGFLNKYYRIMDSDYEIISKL